MKLNRISVLALGALLAAAGLLLAQDGPQNPPAPVKPAPEVPKSKLEEMLQQALRHNPDILVADAKRAEAEAQLNRTRLVVTQKVVLLNAKLDDAKAKVEFAERSMKRVRALEQNRAISQEEVQVAEAALQSAKAELAKVEAELPLLLGTQPVGGTTDPAIQKGLEWLRRYSLDVYGDPNAWRQGSEVDRAQMLKAWERYMGPSDNSNTRAALEAWMTAIPKPPVTGPMAERIKKALDKEMKVSFQGKPLEVLDSLLQEVDGVPHRVQWPENEVIGPATLNLTFKEPVPLGAIIQAYQDSVAPTMRFVVRDYGILVTDVKHLPPGAPLLYDVWKGGKEKKTEKTDKTAGPPLEGLVKEVDEKTGLALVSLGSDAGLTKGQLLEVYRLGENDGEAKYLGQLRVRNVTATESVGEPVAPKKENALKTGDRVTSKLQ